MFFRGRSSSKEMFVTFSFPYLSHFAFQKLFLALIQMPSKLWNMYKKSTVSCQVDGTPKLKCGMLERADVLAPSTNQTGFVYLFS